MSATALIAGSAVSWATVGLIEEANAASTKLQL